MQLLLAESFIADLNGSIERVVVNDLSQDVFYARIIVEVNGRVIEIDSRPSDAIALAVRARCPIMVDDLVMDRAGVSADAEDEDDDAPTDRAQVESAVAAREDELGIFRDFINTLDLEDFEKRRGS